MESINSIDFLNLSKAEKTRIKKQLNRSIKENKNNVQFKNELIKSKKSIDNLLKGTIKLKKEKQSVLKNLPNFNDDYKPSKPKVNRESRILKKTKLPNNISKQDLHEIPKEKYNRTFLGNSFSQTTLTDPEFTTFKIIKSENIFNGEELEMLVPVPNYELIQDVINKEVYLKFFETKREYNLYVNIYIIYIMKKENKDGKVTNEEFILNLFKNYEEEKFYYNSDIDEVIKSKKSN